MNREPFFLVFGNDFAVVQDFADMLSRNWTSAQVKVAYSPQEVSEWLGKVRSGVLVVHSVENRTAIPLIESCRTMFPHIIIAVVAKNDVAYYASRYYKMGVKGVIPAFDDEAQVIHAIQTISNGDIYMNNELLEVLSRSVLTESEVNPFDVLNTREYSIMCLMVDGMTSAQISEETGLNLYVIHYNRMKIWRKLGMEPNNMVALVRLALRYKITKPPVPSSM